MLSSEQPQKQEAEYSGTYLEILVRTKYQRVRTLYTVSTTVTFGEEDLVNDHISDHSSVSIVQPKSFSYLATYEDGDASGLLSNWE